MTRTDFALMWLLVAIEAANLTWTLTPDGPHAAMPFAVGGLVFLLALALYPGGKS